jgi:hypothetical protein
MLGGWIYEITLILPFDLLRSPDYIHSNHLTKFTQIT